MSSAASNLLAAAALATDPHTRADLMARSRIAALQSSMLTCTSCALAATSQRRVPIDGPPNSVVLVGEAPGADEDRHGRPFVGRSGVLLSSALIAAGLPPRERVPVLNTIGCRPPQNDFTLAIEAHAPQRCAQWFWPMLVASGAWIVVTLGGKALAPFTSTPTPVSSARGRLFWFVHPEFGGWLIVPTFHPAYILRDPSQRVRLDEDLALAGRLYRGETGAPSVARTHDISPLVRSLSSPRPVSLFEAEKHRAHFKRTGWTALHSPLLGDRVLVVQDADVLSPSDYADLARYTVAELEILSRWPGRTAVDAWRVHELKRELGAEVRA